MARVVFGARRQRRRDTARRADPMPDRHSERQEITARKKYLVFYDVLFTLGARLSPGKSPSRTLGETSMRYSEFSEW
jgi:hypothetical protein